jgi:hypothetical protein
VRCSRCGSQLVEPASFCSACGTRVRRSQTSPQLPRRASVDDSRDDFLDAIDLFPRAAMAISSLWRGSSADVRFALILGTVLIGAVPMILIGGDDSPEAAAASTSTPAPKPATVGVSAVPESKGKTRLPVELDASAILLAPRLQLDRILGKPTAEQIGDCTRGEQGYVYSDDSYVCVGRGIVMLLSYHPKADVNTSEDALKTLGILTFSPAAQMGMVQRWSHDLDNGLALRNGKPIPNVLYFEAAGPATVTVDMHGWERIRPVKQQVLPTAEGVAKEPHPFAELACKRAIRDSSWNRSSVDFGWLARPAVKHLGSNRWILQFEVTAQNALGTTVDQLVNCTVRCLGSDCTVSNVKSFAP